jgi:hypothetical protein
MPNDPIKLARDIAAQCGCNFKMVAADRQVHKYSPVALRVKKDFNEFTMPPVRSKCNSIY